MRRTKRRMNLYSFYDRSGIERHLEAMAAKGWMLDKIGNLWHYRRCEPGRVRFAVTYYPRASAFDPEPDEEQRAFWDFCEHEGWTLAASSAQLQIFYNRRENPTPVETDPALEVETVRAAAKKSWLPYYILMLVVALMQGAMSVYRIWDDPVEFLASASALMSTIMWGVLIALCASELTGYFRWMRRAARAAERGEFLPANSHAAFQRVALAVVAVTFVVWLISLAFGGDPLIWVITALMFGYIILLQAAVRGLTWVLKKRGASARTNRTATIVTAFVLSFVLVGTVTGTALRLDRSGVLERGPVQPPVTIAALTGGAGEEDWVIRGESSPLLSRRRFQHGLEELWLNYTVTEVRVNTLYGLCRDSYFRDLARRERNSPGTKRFYVEEDPAPWGAAAAYRVAWANGGAENIWLLCYEGRIVSLSAGWELDEAQRAAVGRALGG